MLRNLIIDGSNIVKANLAKNTDDYLANGDYVGGVTGSLRQISKFIDRLEPDNVFVAFDFDKSEFRLKLHPEYKGKREVKDPELKWRFSHTHKHQRILMELFKLMGIYSLEVPKVEADDIIANFVHQSNRHNVIVSTDKDFLQLIDDTTSVYRPGMDVFIGANDAANYCKYVVFKLKEETNYNQDWFVLIRALQSDVSDNIIGAVGVGPVRAVSLFNEYGLDKETIIEGESPKTRKWSQSLVKFLKSGGWELNQTLMNLKDSIKVNVRDYIIPTKYDYDKAVARLIELEYTDCMFENEMQYILDSMKGLRHG